MNKLEQELIAKFVELGCGQNNAAATFQIYMELCEVKRMYVVNYFFSKSLQRMYLTAKYTKLSNTSVFLPVRTSESISMFEIMKNINNDYSCEEIYLALISPDSTCVYYKLSKGLEDPSKQSDIELAMKKREKLDSDINTKRTQIQEAAKSHN